MNRNVPLLLLLLILKTIWGFDIVNYTSRNGEYGTVDICEIAMMGSNSSSGSRFTDTEVIGFCNTLGSSDPGFGYFTMELENPEGAVSDNIADYLATVCVLCFDGNKIWGIEGDGYRLFSIDQETGEYVVYGFTYHFTVLDYSFEEHILYGITLSGEIYSIDIETQECLFMANVPGMIGGGCLGNDNMFYCLEASGGDFWRIDQHNGDYDILLDTAYEYCHPTGFSCDRFTGMIYWWDSPGYFSNAQLKRYDPIEDHHELVGYFPEEATCSAFCIPSWAVNSGVASQVTELLTDVGDNVELSWVNPTETVNGETLENIDHIYIYRNEILIATISETLPGQHDSFTDNDPDEGENCYSIIVINDSGEGAPRDKKVWVGEDMPGKVDEIIINRNGDQVEIYWQPPAQGRHNGEFSGAVSNYHIISSDGQNFDLGGAANNLSFIPGSETLLNCSIMADNTIGDGLIERSVWIVNSWAQPVFLGKAEPEYLSGSIPFNALSYNALSETIYSAAFMRKSGISTGAITGLSYQLYDTHLSENMGDIQYSIYLGETEEIDLIERWVLAEELELVFQGLPDFQEGSQELMIEFVVPYLYNGGNLAIMISRSYVETLFRTKIRVSDIYEQPGCSRNFSSIDTYLHPINMVSPSEVAAHTIAPVVKIHMAGSEQTGVSGIVRNSETGAGAGETEVVLSQGDCSISAISGIDGGFYFPNVRNEIYSLRVAAIGYRCYEDSVTLEGGITDLEINLIPAELIEIYGFVATNDGYPVSGAELRLSGLTQETIFSEEDGSFVFSEVWGCNDFTLNVRTVQRIALPIHFRADSLDTDIGTILLPEHTYRVNNVAAALNQAEEVEISWNAPDTLYLLNEDFDHTNSGFWADRGWGWGTDSLVVNYGRGKFWGTALNNRYGLNVNYSLYSPEFYLDEDNYVLQFEHYLFASYGAGGNVKISVDRGESWELLEPVGGYDDIMNSSSHCNYNQGVYTGFIYNWTECEFDLSEYAFESVMIRFQFGSIFACIECLGWYIDNLRVSRENEERDMQSYRIIKGIDPGDYMNWELIASGLEGMEYLDSNWHNNIYCGDYIYAVQVEYDGGLVSQPAYCEPIQFGDNYSLSISLDPGIGDLKQTDVFMEPEGGFYDYAKRIIGNNMTFENVWQGDYVLRVQSYGFDDHEEIVSVSEDNNISLFLQYFLLPPSSLTIDAQTGMLNWQPPPSPVSERKSISREDVSLYKIYLDGELIMTTDLLMLDLSRLPLFEIGECYEIGVTALYDYKESNVISEEFICEFVVNDQAPDEIPFTTAINAVYPNPFNPEITVSYQLAENEIVNLSIYDIRGRKVKTLINEKQNAGRYQRSWTASDSASGIYFLRFKSGSYHHTRKIILLK
ncbi:MAG: T9SS type A sorting domain-containing protein [Candidatus Cloacimonetes bacterium]|nr:T9SS type A sorting domain-containing protein [Candidatus Cloacimonadota bacterium]